jgi:GSH-dependent disulfide-bond oxidoreductase
MIHLHYWPTPNGHKVTLFLEETETPYEIHPVNIGKGDQFKPDFLKIAPNNRMPAIIDNQPADGGAPISVFESGAILLYLAEKTGKFIAPDLRGRVEVLQWLFWQMGGLGPMAGQNNHFAHYAPEKIPYAIERYVKETARLFAVMDHRLGDREFLAGAYSIADMASYPWTTAYVRMGQNIDDFPNLKRWQEAIKARPATQRAYEKGKQYQNLPPTSEEARKILFGQDAATVRRAGT